VKNSPQPFQLDLFPLDTGDIDDDLPPLPPRPPRRYPATRRRRRRTRSSPPGQLSLFDATGRPPATHTPSPVSAHGRDLPVAHPATYLEIAQTLGLRNLLALAELPATHCLLDTDPLETRWFLPAPLDVRDRIVHQLHDAFADLADSHIPEMRDATVSLWGTGPLPDTRRRHAHGHLLLLAVSTNHRRALDPFLLRLRGYPGVLEVFSGPPPLEEGAEMLSLYHRERLYPLLPVEMQPTLLSDLLWG